MSLDAALRGGLSSWTIRAQGDRAMIVVRLVGWLLVLIALMILGRDLLAWYDSGTFAPESVDQLWFELFRRSRTFVQGLLERDAAPWFGHIIFVALLLWAAPAVAVPGVALIWAGRRRLDTRGRRQRA
jgi:hypothetical protein